MPNGQLSDHPAGRYPPWQASQHLPGQTVQFGQTNSYLPGQYPYGQMNPNPHDQAIQFPSSSLPPPPNRDNQPPPPYSELRFNLNETDKVPS